VRFRGLACHLLGLFDALQQRFNPSEVIGARLRRHDGARVPISYGTPISSSSAAIVLDTEG
jgi:hypothetical protein